MVDLKKQENWNTILSDDIDKQTWLGSDSESDEGEEENDDDDSEESEEDSESPMET